MEFNYFYKVTTKVADYEKLLREENQRRIRSQYWRSSCGKPSKYKIPHLPFASKLKSKPVEESSSLEYISLVHVWCHQD